jgi:hypothetical protein
VQLLTRRDKCSRGVATEARVSRSSPARTTMIAVAVVAAGAAVVAWCWRQACERAAWKEVHARALALAPPRHVGTIAHEPLLGPARPGRADEGYRLAAARYDDAQQLELGRDPPAPWQSLAEELVAEQPLPADIAGRLAPFAAMLAALAAGAASDTIELAAFLTPLQSWQRPFDLDDLRGHTPIGITPLATTALVAARDDLSHARWASAIQRTADVLTLARDQLDAGHGLYDLMGACQARTCCELWSDAALARLPPESLRQLGSVLMRLDAAAPPASTCARDACLLLVELAIADASFDAEPQQLAQYLDAVAALPAATAPWSVREPALAAAAACLPPALRADLPQIERFRRDALARVRLLRMAVACHLGDAPPRLADPLGDGALRVEPFADWIRLASGDGIDDEPIERVVRR